MNKRILSILLCFTLVLSLLVSAVPAYADPVSTCTFTVEADKTTACRGDTINFTVYMQQTGKQNTLEFTVVPPEGLTYVANSATLGENIQETMGFDEVAWTEQSMYCSGFGAYSYTGTDKNVLLTFKCTVDDDAAFKTYEFGLVDHWADDETYHTKNAVVVPAEFSVMGTVEGALAVTGVTAPAKGQSPVAFAAAPANTSVASVKWYDGNDEVTGTFQGGKAYTVKVTLAPAANYEFGTITDASVNGETADFAKSGDNLVVSYTFDALPAKEVQSIEITAQPTKKAYVEGQAFDKTGMVVTAIYDDMSSEPVTGYTVAPAAFTVGDIEVTVSYGGKNAVVTGITVEAKAITSIDITSEPTKKVYEIGEAADWTGMVVNAEYNDSSNRNLNSNEYTVTGFDSSAYADSQTITVTAGGKTDTFTIKIDKKAVPVDAFTYTAPVNLEYDKTAKAATVEAKAPYDGAPVVIYKQGGAAAEPKAAGTYDVYVSAAETATYKAAAEYKIGSFTITPKGLTMTASAKAKAYDGLASTDILAESPNGVIVGDDVAVAEASVAGTFADAWAGTGKASTAGANFTLKGADAANYTLTQPTGITGDISAAAQTITVESAAKNVVKGGSKDLTAWASSNAPNAVLKFTMEQPVAGVALTQAGVLTVADTVAANTMLTIKVNADAVDAGGTADSEYTAATAADMVVTVVDKEDADVAIGQIPAGNKVAYGDTFTLKATAANTENGGTWTWTVDGAAFDILSGQGTDTLTVKANAADAYAKNITASYESAGYIGSDTAAITVEPKAIAIPAEVNTVFTYNGAAQVYNLAENDAYTIAGNEQTAANETGYEVTVTLKDALNTKWSDDTTGAKNYTFIIKKAPITVTAKSYTINVNGTVPDLAQGTHYTVTGLVGSDVLGGTIAVKYQQNGQDAAPDKTKAGTYDIVISGAEAPNANYAVPVHVNGTLKIQQAVVGGGGGGYYGPTVQKPIIEAGEGVKVTLSADGKIATIEAEAGFELDTVVLNGTDKGIVKEVKGLKTGDKLVITAKKIVTEPDYSDIIAALDDYKLAARSKMVTMKNGKKAVKITWYDEDGRELDFDGVEIFRSIKRYKGYGTKPFFETEKDQYYNTLINRGTKYFYKVRGYVEIDGEKYYTQWSKKAWRTVK